MGCRKLSSCTDLQHELSCIHIVYAGSVKCIFHKMMEIENNESSEAGALAIAKFDISIVHIIFKYQPSGPAFSKLFMLFVGLVRGRQD